MVCDVLTRECVAPVRWICTRLRRSSIRTQLALAYKLDACCCNAVTLPCLAVKEAIDGTQGVQLHSQALLPLG
jgi:hypothetical protein